MLEQINEDHNNGGGHGDDQAPDLEKKKEKQNWLKAKAYLIGSFCFGAQDI